MFHLVLRLGGAYRSSGFLWGKACLPQHRQDKVRLGNATFRAALAIIRSAIANYVPLVGENPLTSMAWQVGEMRRLLRSRFCRTARTDQCQHGARWKKATLFASWHAGDALELLHLRCKPRRRICAATGQPHIVLQGTIPGSSVAWSSRAEAYPRKMAGLLASWLLRAADGLEAHRTLNIIGG